MASMFTLAADIVLNTTGFSSGVSEAKGEMSSLQSSFQKAGNKIKGLLAASLSVAAFKQIATGIWDLATSTASFGDNIDKASQKLGISRKAYQEWDYILSQNGSSIDSMTTAFRTMSNGITDGTKKTKTAIGKLGLDFDKMQSMSPEQQFESLIVALQGCGSESEKLSIATDLFGRSATELMPLLNSDANSVEELKEKAEELGIIMSDDAVDSSVKFTDSLDTLKRTFTSLKNSIGSSLLDGMTSIMDTLAPVITSIIDGFNENGLLGAISATSDALFAFASEGTAQMANSENPFVSTLGSSLQSAMNLINNIKTGIESDEFSVVFENVFGHIGGIIDGAFSTLNGLWDNIYTWLTGDSSTQELIQGVFTDMFGTDSVVEKALNAVGDWGGGLLSKIYQDLTNDANGAEMIKTYFDDLFGNGEDGVGIGAILESVGTSAGNMLTALSELFSGDTSVGEALSGFVDALFGEGSAWATIANTVGTLGTDIISNLVSAFTGDDFQTAKEKVENFFGGIAQKIQEAIDAWNRFWGIGDQSDKLAEQYMSDVNGTVDDLISNYFDDEVEVKVAIDETDLQAKLTRLGLNLDVDKLNSWAMSHTVEGTDSAYGDWVNLLKHANTNAIMNDTSVLAELQSILGEEEFKSAVQVSVDNSQIQSDIDAVEYTATVVLNPDYSNMPNNSDTRHRRRGHATGLDFVPYDGYQATLHRGERILTSLQNYNYSKNKNDTEFGGMYNDNSTALHVESMTIASDVDASVLATQISDLTKRRHRGYGY